MNKKVKPQKVTNTKQVSVTNEITYNFSKKVLDNETYLVVPLVMIVEGVLNGVVYNAEEIYKSVNKWNNVPVVINHPDDYSSARVPAVLSEVGVGNIFNADYRYTDDDKLSLVAEAWLKTSKLKSNFEELYNRISNNEVIEVSTGLTVYLKSLPAGTIINDQEAYAMAQDYAPDHLAILPEAIGACSIADGCGIRNKKEGDTINAETKEDKADNSERETKRKETNMACKCPTKVKALHAVSKISKEELSLLGEPAINSLLVAYNVEDPKEETTEEVADEVADVEETEEKAENQDTEDSKPTETEKEEETTEEEVAEEVADVEETEEPAKEEESSTEEEVKQINSVEDLKEYEVEASFMNTINEGIKMFNTRKESVIAEIKANPNNKFSDESLGTKSMEDLEAIKAIMGTVENDNNEYTGLNSLATAKKKKAVAKGITLYQKTK